MLALGMPRMHPPSTHPPSPCAWPLTLDLADVLRQDQVICTGVKGSQGRSRSGLEFMDCAQGALYDDGAHDGPHSLLLKGADGR